MSIHPPPRSSQHDVEELDGELVSLISEVWTRGWMPGDVLAAVGHNFRSPVVRLVAALIQREHAERDYGDRLSPRWQRQLVEARELVADPHATISAHFRGWWGDRIELREFLGFLPELRRLGPLPGEADPGAVRPGGEESAGTGRGEADPDVLRRVRALLAKAESSGFDAEAEAFTTKAQALIATHSLEDALRDHEGGGPTDGPDAMRLAVERPYDREKFRLLGVVARSNRCRSIWHDGLGFATVVGYPIDLEATELLFTSLLVQATRAMQRRGSTTDGYGNSTTRSFRRSFLQGFAGRIGERLSAETEWATTDAAAAEPDGPLLPVLAGRAEQVDRFIEDAFPDLSRMRRSRATFDGTGYLAGVAAADRADLAARRRLAS